MAASPIETPREVPAEVPAEAPATEARQRAVISKASIRRLAHDAGARLGRDAHLAAVVELEVYVQRLLELAVHAMTYARRKSVGVSHVLFAAEAHGGVPAELRRASEQDLKRLQRCNPLAPVGLRKETLCHTEISEASFAKVTKGVARRCKEKLRITGAARHLLQLLTEHHLMQRFAQRAGPLADGRHSSTERLFAEVLGCADAQALVRAFDGLCERLPALMDMADTKTVDERLVRAAMQPDHAWAATLDAGAAPPAAPDVVKIMTRLLRGRAADKRVTTGAGAFLASALQHLQGLQQAGDQVQQQCGAAAAA